jgi:hypothetical protein
MPARFIDSGMDKETVQAIMIAFDLARKELGLTAQTDAVTDYLAQKIVTFAKGGERNAGRLRDLALKAIRQNH